MKPEKLSLALDMLTRPVPAPAQPRAKPQDSFAQLKVGQRLELLSKGYIGTKCLEPGTIWEVTSVDSLGAYCVLLGGPEPTAINSIKQLTLVIRDRDWKGKLFARWKKPPKAKGKQK